MGSVVLEARFNPYGDVETIGNAAFKVPGYGLLVQVTVVPRGQATLSEAPTWVPAIVDTGCSANVVIAADHLELFGGPGAFRYIGKARGTYGSGETGEFSLYDGDIWIRSSVSPLPPFKLELKDGFAVAKAEEGRPGPRTPVVGARSLATANLLLTVDYHLLRFTLQTPDPATVLHLPGQAGT